jgi:hypothetical protein
MKKSLLIKNSLSVFESHHVDTVYATSDGQYFIDENRANLHQNSDGKKLTVYTISQEEATEANTPKKSEILNQSVKDLTASLEEISSVEELYNLLAEESNIDTRKSAIAAINDRIESITKVED